MLKLRPYQKEDAKEIVTWIKDERDFRKWSADVFLKYPIKAKDLQENYANAKKSMSNGFIPITAYNDSGIVGQLFIRFLDKEKKIARFGLVIVDDKKRGQGYGKEMLQLALKYAFEQLKVDKVTLGVFENNPSAYYCYKAAGVKDIEEAEPIFYTMMGEQWKCLELEYKEGKSMKCKSLEEVRENIDRIDDAIIKLIAERETYVKEASAFKTSEEGVKAPNRVEAVIAKVRKRAADYGANPDMVEALYREMISRFVSMEMDEFKKI